MKKAILSLFLILVTAAYAVSPGEYFFTSTGTISFTSEAPLELIKASSSQVRGLIDEAKKTFSFRVAYRSFEGFNSGLQREHFNEKYMEDDKYPEAIFNGTIPDEIDFSGSGVYAVETKGMLNIHGVAKERTLKSTVIVNNGQTRIESKFTVLLADHNISIPKIVTQKIATEIAVVVKADLKKKVLVN